MSHQETKQWEFMIACADGALEQVCELAADPEVDVNLREPLLGGVTGLHLATTNANPRVVEFLLTLPQTNPMIGSLEDGTTPLLSAMRLGNLELATLLLTSRQAVEHRLASSGGYLALACMRGRRDMVELLLRQPYTIDTATGIACQAARIFGHDDIAELVERYQQDPATVIFSSSSSCSHAPFLERKEEEEEKMTRAEVFFSSMFWTAIVFLAGYATGWSSFSTTSPSPSPPHYPLLAFHS